MPRGEDPRPPIEVLGAGPPEEPPRRVTIGSDGGGRRRGLFLGILVVVALVVAGLLLTDGDEPDEKAERQSTTTTSTTRVRRPRLTTTTTAFVATGPVLPVQTGALVLVTNGGGRWYGVELDTGARQVVELGSMDPFAVPVRDGVVIVEAGRASYVPLRGSDREPRDLGRADQVSSAGRDDAVWTLAYPDPNQGFADQTVRLIDLDGGVLRSFDLVQADRYFGSSTADGLLYSEGGRVFVVDERGSRAIAVGELYSSGGNRVLVRECDEVHRCGFVLIEVDTGRRAVLTPSAISGGMLSGGSTMSSEGEVLLTTYSEDGMRGELFDAEGRLVGSGSLEEFGVSAIAFLPGGQGILAAGESGIVRIAPDGEGRLQVEALPAFAGLPAAAVGIVIVP